MDEGSPPESLKPLKYRRFRRSVPVKKHARSSLDGRRRISVPRPDDPCRAKYSGPCRAWNQDFGTRILVPRSWYQDPGTKILVPKKKTESPRGGASRYAGGHGGLQAPLQGVWGAGSPPGRAGGLGGGSPPVKTILW